MYVYDFEGYNKKLYSIFDETYTPEQVERACSYGNYSTTFYYTYISDAEKPEYDKYLQEMYTIKFNEKTGKIEGSEERVLGGDDKCGIALALATAHALPKLPMKILFTTGEEKGCDGISEFCKTNKEWFDDCKFSITIDRRDNDNLLRWSAGKANCSKEFAAQLALFGVLSEIPVKVESGTLADVIHIRNHVKETVNISAGYHNPHSTEEWIDFYAMCDILEWLKRIVQYAKV
jgi:di/tripeptidase